MSQFYYPRVLKDQVFQTISWFANMLDAAGSSGEKINRNRVPNSKAIIAKFRLSSPKLCDFVLGDAYTLRNLFRAMTIHALCCPTVAADAIDKSLYYYYALGKFVQA